MWGGVWGVGCRARLRVALRRARGTTARFHRGKKTTRKKRAAPSRSFSSVSTANTTRSVPRTRRTVPRRRSRRVSIHPPFRTSLSAAPPPAPPRPTAATTPSPERASSSRVKVEADPPRIARDSTVSRSRGRSRRGRSRRGRSRRGCSRRGFSRRGRLDPLETFPSSGEGDFPRCLRRRARCRARARRLARRRPRATPPRVFARPPRVAPTRPASWTILCSDPVAGSLPRVFVVSLDVPSAAETSPPRRRRDTDPPVDDRRDRARVPRWGGRFARLRERTRGRRGDGVDGVEKRADRRRGGGGGGGPRRSASARRRRRVMRRVTAGVVARARIRPRAEKCQDVVQRAPRGSFVQRGASPHGPRRGAIFAPRGAIFASLNPRRGDSPLACSSSEGARREGASLFRRAPPVTCDSGLLALSSGVARHLAYLESMRAIASQPHALDSSTGRLPLASLASGSAPASRSARATVKCPRSAARCVGVFPASSLASRFAPPSTSRAMTSVRGRRDAGGGGGGRDGTHDGYVERSFDVSVDLRETSGKTACVSGPTTPPQLARLAWWSGVRPATSGAFGSAPAARSASAAPAHPPAAATWVGVRRRKSDWSGCSPRRSRRRIASAASSAAASCMVLPRVPRADLRAAGSPVVSSEADGILGVTTTAGDGGGRLRLPRALDRAATVEFVEGGEVLGVGGGTRGRRAPPRGGGGGGEGGGVGVVADARRASTRAARATPSYPRRRGPSPISFGPGGTHRARRRDRKTRTAAWRRPAVERCGARTRAVSR